MIRARQKLSVAVFPLSPQHHLHHPPPKLGFRIHPIPPQHSARGIGAFSAQLHEAPEHKRLPYQQGRNVGQEAASPCEDLAVDRRGRIGLSEALECNRAREAREKSGGEQSVSAKDKSVAVNSF